MNKIAQLIYDSYKGNIPTQYATMDKTVREDAIRKEIFSVLGIEKYEPTTFRKAWRKNKNDVYTIIEDVVDQVILDGEYAKDTFFNEFVEIKSNALGDKNEFYAEGTNKLEFAEFSGSHFDLKRRRVDGGQKFSTEVRDYGVKIFEFFERVASGRADMGKLVVLITDAVNRKMSDIAQGTFAQALNNLPSALKVTGTYNETNILKALTLVEGANGTTPILVGTKSALAKLQDKITVKSDNMLDELNNNGLLTMWKGYRCVEIKQGINLGELTTTMSDTDIYVLTGGEKPVKIFLEGDTEVKEIADGITNADRSIEQAVIMKVGSAVCYNKLVASIQLS